MSIHILVLGCPKFAKMLVFFSLLVFSAVKVNANGEFMILHHPKSIIFKGHDHLTSSTVKEVYSSSLGFSNSHFPNWKGVFISDPFYLAECIATVYVEGVQSLGQTKAHHFPLKIDTDNNNVFQSVKDSIELRYPEENSQIINIDLSNNLEDIVPHEIFKGIKNDKPKKLNTLFLKNNAEDREFLKEIHLLNKIADNISGKAKSDGVPDLFWFKVSSLLPLTKLYGVNSTQSKEAQQLLNEAIFNLNDAFKKAYNGAVLFSVITSDGSHTRKTRNVLAAPEERNLNLASDYSENYPVIFNIILWLSVVLGFSLLAISLAIGGMDPGRDSIIYRMTNPRMKKDN